MMHPALWLGLLETGIVVLISILRATTGDLA